MRKRDQIFIHKPTGIRCRYFKKRRNSPTALEVLFLDGSGFHCVCITQLEPVNEDR